MNIIQLKNCMKRCVKLVRRRGWLVDDTPLLSGVRTVTCQERQLLETLPEIAAPRPSTKMRPLGALAPLGLTESNWLLRLCCSQRPGSSDIGNGSSRSMSGTPQRRYILQALLGFASILALQLRPTQLRLCCAQHGCI